MSAGELRAPPGDRASPEIRFPFQIRYQPPGGGVVDVADAPALARLMLGCPHEFSYRDDGWYGTAMGCGLCISYVLEAGPGWRAGDPP